MLFVVRTIGYTQIHPVAIMQSVPHRKHTDTPCGQNAVRTSQEAHYVSATEPNRLMLFGETVAVYCERDRMGLVWTGLVWVRIGTGGELLWIRWWTFGFHKMLGNYQVASQLVALLLTAPLVFPRSDILRAVIVKSTYSLRREATQSGRSSPTFRRNILPLSPGSKNRPSKKPTRSRQ
jgi:hypothetical protein